MGRIISTVIVINWVHLAGFMAAHHLNILIETFCSYSYPSCEILWKSSNSNMILSQETAAALLPGRSPRPLPAHLPSSMFGLGSHSSIVSSSSSSCHLQRRTHRCEQPGCDKVGSDFIKISESKDWIFLKEGNISYPSGPSIRPFTLTIIFPISRFTRRVRT